jgi:hypothetical protein
MRDYGIKYAVVLGSRNPGEANGMRILAGLGPALALVFCIPPLLPGPALQDASQVPSRAQTLDPFQTALVLKAAREYCRRLEKAAIDFVCREETTERIDLSRDLRPDHVSRWYLDQASGEMNVGLPPPQRPPVPRDFRKAGSVENTYVFDYQFVRQSGKITERREILDKNGKKAGKKEEPPKTEAFQYADILLAPVRLLDERFGEYYDYRLLREDTLDGTKVWVLDVVPRLSLVDVYLGGKLWLKQDDSSILRIDWDPTTFGRYENILRRAKIYKCEPQVTSTTEFAFEKNGLRFPSVDLTEEAYQDQQGKKFVRAITKVAYKDYKFFTVETETEFKR